MLVCYIKLSYYLDYYRQKFVKLLRAHYVCDGKVRFFIVKVLVNLGRSES
ncbi:hypothetical protein HMPREF1555_01683 [Porphyromonas gingivalis F0570]|uniref:Uncharacterized protein n=1 Tax=Porphyromonas gingivalis F0570 TaxID=1227271 RepID=A0A0E2LP30_PORGN|nr:hypothetical protein HMPREF1555_01683 [Porphyromonas gingivalis F0570]